MILGDDMAGLEKYIPEIERFLSNKLKLELHPDKIIVRKLKQGIDFLGYVALPHYRVLRTKTKRRMFGRINSNNLPSYFGLLKHCNSFQLRQELLSEIF